MLVKTESVDMTWVVVVVVGGAQMGEGGGRGWGLAQPNRCVVEYFHFLFAKRSLK